MEIVFKYWYKWQGIPRYIQGHNCNQKGLKRSDEFKKRVSETLTGTHRPQEVKDKISISQSGEKNHWYGKKQSDESNKKRSEKLKGRVVSDETRKKISNKNKGKWSWLKGKNISDETKNKISIANSGINNGMYGKVQSVHGKRFYYDSVFQGKVCFRSSWELKYAQYLDLLNINWYYEYKTFKLSDEMTYTPDFFLPQFKKFIEIKGWMHKNSQERINKFKDEYDCNLEILMKEDLIKLGIKL